MLRLLQGAAAAINNSAILTAAAGILAVEAYHAGAVREALYNGPQNVALYNATVGAITGVSLLNATLTSEIAMHWHGFLRWSKKKCDDAVYDG